MSSRVAVTVSPSRVRVPYIDRFCRVSLRFVGMAPLDPQRNRRSVDAGQLFSVVVAILHVLVGRELNQLQTRLPGFDDGRDPYRQ